MIINNVVTTGPALPVPGHLSFAQFIVDRLIQNTETEDYVALVNGDTGANIMSRKILHETVNVATGLRQLGIKRGDVVAICSENCDEYMPAALGTICCGATLTTYNVQYSKDELAHVLSISKPKIVFASVAGLKSNLATFKTTATIQKIIQFNGQPVDSIVTAYRTILVPTNPLEFEPEEVQGWTDTVFILYSSGTTGLPKGVMITHLNALYSAASFGDQNDVQTTRLLTVVPWYHAYGLISTINYLLTKQLLVYLTVFNPLKYLGAIQEYKITTLAAVPPIIVFLAKHPVVLKYDLSSVTRVWCGAAPLSAETIDLTLKRMPNCKGVFQAYGMTETSLIATTDTPEENAVKKPGSGGYPLSGVKVKVTDIQTGKKLGLNEPGEICIKGPIVMKGYAGKEEETRAMFDHEGFLKTGDIGYYDKDGCFFIVDRLKELIKYKGVQVAPAMVESVFLQHSGVAECGVVGAPDEAAGELPTAFVVLKPGVNVTEKELLDFTSTKLSKTSQIRGGVIFVNEIPKNPSGKILRRALKQILLEKSKSKL